MYRSLTDVYLKESFKRSVPPPYEPVIRLVTEGGAAGHMDHIFDVQGVDNGRTLIQTFERAIDSILKSPPSVKWDGVNVSAKVVTHKDGQLEFGLDRGSNKPIDVGGVTIARLPERFSNEGQIEDGRQTLTILNAALPTIKEDLAKLKMLDGRHLLNMEFIDNQSNAIAYDERLLIIHGILEIIEVRSPKKGSISRGTNEVTNYNKDAFNDMIAKLDKIAKSYQFRVQGVVPASPKVDADVHKAFNTALNTAITIKRDSEHADTKTLRAWLDEVKNNPKGVILNFAPGIKKTADDIASLIDGKPMLRGDALSKFVYNSVIGGFTVSELVPDKNQQAAAIGGAIFYHAARILGNAIINSLTTAEFGDIDAHEGIVVRDPKISQRPFKITGEFIVRGPRESKFKKAVLPAEQDNEEIISSIGNDYLNGPNALGKANYSNTYMTRVIGGNNVGGGSGDFLSSDRVGA